MTNTLHATYEIISKHHEIAKGDMKAIEAERVRHFRGPHRDNEIDRFAY